jgi:hypothetical protein
VEKVNQKIDSDDSDSDTVLIDMICWFEDKYRDIDEEDLVMNKLREYYHL